MKKMCPEKRVEPATRRMGLREAFSGVNAQRSPEICAQRRCGSAAGWAPDSAFPSDKGVPGTSSELHGIHVQETKERSSSPMLLLHGELRRVWEEEQPRGPLLG